MPKVFLESITEPGRIWEMTKFPFRLGEARDNDLVVDCQKKDDGHQIKEYVSGYHAEIRDNEGHYSIADLNSLNGTYVNKTRIKKETALNSGDELSISPSYHMRFFASEESLQKHRTEPLATSATVPINTQEQ